MEFKKVLLRKNQGSIDSEIHQLNPQKNYFQNYINQVIALGFEVKENDLEPLFENPKAYITEKITAGENLQVGNLTLNKEKLFDLIEKPIGTNELIKSIESDKEKQTIREGTIWKLNQFSINENNKVIIKPSVLDWIENNNSIFIESENQQTGYDKVVLLANLLTEINAISKTKLGGSTELSELLIHENGVFEPRTDFVKRF